MAMVCYVTAQPSRGYLEQRAGRYRIAQRTDNLGQGRCQIRVAHGSAFFAETRLSLRRLQVMMDAGLLQPSLPASSVGGEHPT